MENTSLMQLQSLFIFILSGIIIGIFFDIFRILRKTFKTADFITYLEDILFWIVTGIFLIWLIFVFEKGEIRNYTIIGLGIGIIFYLLYISKHFIKINVKILTFVKNWVYRVLKIILYPFIWIIKTFMKLFRHIFEKPFSFFVINITNFAKNKKKKKDFKEECRKI